ncbi:hypothetical protein OESDEN_22925, partial [Oesophagostomum dentatum]
LLNSQHIYSKQVLLSSGASRWCRPLHNRDHRPICFHYNPSNVSINKVEGKLDDQVTVLLSSMQLRIDQKEGIRRKKKMRETKLRAQLWLAELRSRSLNRLSRRYRSASAYAVRPREKSVSSAPMPMVTSAPKMASRTRSFNGTLPAIVVQDEVAQEEFSSGSRAISRWFSELLQ